MVYNQVHHEPVGFFKNIDYIGWTETVSIDLNRPGFECVIVYREG